MFLLLTSGRILESGGGEENFTISCGKWLRKQNYDITIMGSGFASVKTLHLPKSNNDPGILEKKKKTRVLYPPYIVYMLSRLFLSLLWIFKILLLNRRTTIELIHSQDTGYSGLAAVLSGKILRVPVILSSHGIRSKSLELIIHSKFKNAILKFEHSLDVFTIKNANAIIAINPLVKKYCEKHSKKNVEYIPIPIKSKNFEFSETNRESFRKEFGIEKRMIVIGYIGRLSPEKNLLTLLTSFANASKKNSFKLIIVGAGICEPELKEFVQKKKIQDKVIFCGFRHDIGKILSGFDIFVNSSFTEGLPTALLEAMASGRAVICSNIPAHQELIRHNLDGLLVDPNKSEEFQESIELLSKNDLLRKKLGSNAKLKASKYDEELIFPKILEYYRKYLTNREVI